MKTTLLFFLISVAGFASKAQAVAGDSLLYAKVIVQKDRRIDILGEKMYAYNDGLKKNIRSARGYRLMVLSSNDRNLAMKLRSSLLQQYPQHKVYMVYQNPFIKLKMGNFVEKAEAENFKKQLIRQGVVPGNIYLLSEMVEIKPELDDETE